MCEVCKVLGFVTDNALNYAKVGSDHHKLWDILEISYIAFTDELLWEFLVYAELNSTEPATESFWEFSKRIENPNSLPCNKWFSRFYTP